MADARIAGASRRTGHRHHPVGGPFCEALRAGWLAPEITQAILTGTHPPALTAIRLVQGPRLPFDWPGQRVALGFI